MTDASPRLYAAVDLGGTNIRSIIADGSGRVLSEDMRLSDTKEGLDAVVQRMVESIDAAMANAEVEKSRIDGLGIASPGAVDVRWGIVPEAPQLPGWYDVPLSRILQERTGLRTIVTNDANAAALGENQFGAGRGSRFMLYFTVSTGVGGGIIAGGHLYEGKSGAAGELGHVTLDVNGPPCGCGANGCLEAFSSGTALARRGEELAAGGESEALARLREAEGPVTAAMMHRAAEEGDEASREAFREAGRYFGIALAGYVNIFDPEVIVVGGGVSKAGELLFGPARAEMESRAMRQPLSGVRLVPAALGQLGGTLGMIARVRDSQA